MWLWIESTRPVLVAAASSHVRFAGCSVAEDMSTAVGGMLLLVGGQLLSRRLDASRGLAEPAGTALGKSVDVV